MTRLKHTTVVDQGVSQDQKAVKENVVDGKAGDIDDEGHTEGSGEDDDIGGEEDGEKVDDVAGKVVGGDEKGDQAVKGPKADRKVDEERPRSIDGELVSDPKVADENLEKESHDGRERRPGECDEERNRGGSAVKGRVDVVEDQKGKEGSGGRGRSPVVAGNAQQLGEDVEEDEKEGKPNGVDIIAIESCEFPHTNGTDNRHHPRPQKNKQLRRKPPIQRKRMNKQWQLHHQLNRSCLSDRSIPIRTIM